MTAKTGKQMISIHILPQILKSKSNQNMKFGHSTECNMKDIFFKNHDKNEAEGLVTEIFLFSKNSLHEVRFNIFW